ncbi:hypothetical protein GCM10023155_36220 [Bremerella cremea]
MLILIDEYTRECLAIDVARQLTSEGVLERLSDLFVRRGVPDLIRSDNGSEFTAVKVRDWLGRVEVNTWYIESGSPWKILEGNHLTTGCIRGGRSVVHWGKIRLVCVMHNLGQNARDLLGRDA